MVSSLFELIDDPQLASLDDPEERFTRSEVNWQQYEAVLAKLENNSHYRVTYLDGVLEIVSPSLRHEKLKKRLATLVEFYLLKKRIKHTPMGSPTVKKRLKRAGAEPDECYCIGEEKSIPDLAIEVVITSGSIDKLETYRRLEVTEVWMWKVNRLTLYHLREETPSKFLQTHGYEQITLSELLPDLNIPLLEQCVMISDQIQAIDEFEEGMG
ncbi:Uma2 family endonuclease [Microcoleus sp. FACHB-SPT15]|uniref:Uma2 family endonuclease n=1 Tax=Microcoleus sp. FACHB-SPT15 TaxID=2692830 RepID=UPI00177AED58|nr:Uma2 family endonuclease [Microcoleus sp. FACHB-SPT15]MBD1808399.1 Uma2 family endonuclease [Microcoleus sp. FACHB-SPT15]